MGAIVETDPFQSGARQASCVAQSQSGQREPIFSNAFVLVLAVQAAFGLCFSAFFILPKFLTLRLGATAEQIGVVTAAAGIIPLLATPFIGSWIDSFGRKRFILAGAGLCALASLVFVWVDIYGPLLFTLRIVQGIAFAFAFNAAATLVVDITPHERLGQALGFFGVSMLATNGLTPYLLEPIAEQYGWKPVFLFSAIAGALAFALALLLREPIVYADKTPDDGSFGSEVSLKFMGATLLSSCAVGAGFGVIFAFYQPFALKLGMSQMRGFFVGFSLAAIATRLGLSDLADRVGRRRISVAAMLLYGAAVIAMAGLRPGILEWLGVTLGLAHGVIYPALNALAIESVSDGARGRAMTYYSSAFTLGSTLSVWFLGWLASRVGFPPIFILAGSAVIIAAGILSVKGRSI